MNEIKLPNSLIFAVQTVCNFYITQLENIFLRKWQSFIPPPGGSPMNRLADLDKNTKRNIPSPRGVYEPKMMTFWQTVFELSAEQTDRHYSLNYMCILKACGSRGVNQMLGGAAEHLKSSNRSIFLANCGKWTDLMEWEIKWREVRN